MKNNLMLFAIFAFIFTSGCNSGQQTQTEEKDNNN